MRPILLDIVTNVITHFTLFRTYPQITSSPSQRGKRGFIAAILGNPPKSPFSKGRLYKRKLLTDKLLIIFT